MLSTGPFLAPWGTWSCNDSGTRLPCLSDDPSLHIRDLMVQFEHILGTRKSRLCQLTNNCSEVGKWRNGNVVSVAVQLDGFVGKRWQCVVLEALDAADNASCQTTHTHTHTQTLTLRVPAQLAHEKWRSELALPAMEHWGACPPSTSNNPFLVHFRAAQSLTATLCGCIFQHIRSLYWFCHFICHK